MVTIIKAELDCSAFFMYLCIMDFILSQWGKHKEFESLEKAIEFCKKKKILGTHEYLIWINGYSRIEMNKWRLSNKEKFDDDSMRLTYTNKKKYIWCSVENKWFELNKYLELE